jgi:hypothetical protein
MEVTKEIKYGDEVKTSQRFYIKYMLDVNNYKHNDRAELSSYIEKINMMQWVTILLEIMHAVNS